VGSVVDAVCAAAGIHTSKLKVVGLYEGSTVVQMFVEGSSPEAGNSDNAEELTDIVLLIGQEAENGNLDEINGWIVLDLQITECFGSLEEAESYSIYELPYQSATATTTTTATTTATTSTEDEETTEEEGFFITADELKDFGPVFITCAIGAVTIIVIFIILLVIRKRIQHSIHTRNLMNKRKK
jgi:hypothetical protein